jgi:hypothetical protein
MSLDVPVRRCIEALLQSRQPKWKARGEVRNDLLRDIQDDFARHACFFQGVQ